MAAEHGDDLDTSKVVEVPEFLHREIDRALDDFLRFRAALWKAPPTIRNEQEFYVP